MAQVKGPPQPKTLGVIDSVAVQADFGAPLHVATLVGLCWFLTGQRYPAMRRSTRFALTFIWSLLFAVGFVLHSLGHMISARAVGAPMDVLLINAAHWATLYYDNNVMPEAHLGRAVGGPVANLGGVVLGRFGRKLLPPGPFGRDLLDVFVLFNLFIGSLGLLPAPLTDGGALVKWGIYRWTRDFYRSSLAVRYLGVGASLGFGGGAALALFLRRRLLGAVLALFGLVTALEFLRRD